MMDAGSTWFQRKLEAAIVEMQDRAKAYMAEGISRSLEDYRERVGYYRALTDILAISAETAKEGSDANGGGKPAKPSDRENNLYPFV